MTGLCAIFVSGCIVGAFPGKTVKVSDVTRPTNLVFSTSVHATNVTGVRLFVYSHLNGMASLTLGDPWSHLALTNYSCNNWSSDWDTNTFRVDYLPTNVTGGTLTIKCRFETK